MLCDLCAVCLCVYVCVCFRLTDRASTIPSNVRDRQSDTWSAGQKKNRETSTGTKNRESPRKTI